MGHVPSKDFCSQPFVMDLVGRSAGQERLVGIGLTKYYFPSAQDPLFQKFCAVRGENHVRHWYDRPEEVSLNDIPPVPSDEELYHRFIDAPSAVVDQGLDIPDWSPIPLMIVKMDDPNDVSLPNADNCVVVGYFACIDYQLIAKKLPSLGGDDNDEEEPKSPTRNTVPITNIVKRLDVAAASSNPMQQFELLFNEFNTAHIFMSNRFYNEAKSICCFRLACACYDFYSRKAHLNKKSSLPPTGGSSSSGGKKKLRSSSTTKGGASSDHHSSSNDSPSSEDISPKGTPPVDPLARIPATEKFEVPWPRGMGYETFQTNLPRLRLTQQLNAVCYSLGLDITSEALVELRPDNRVYLGLHGPLLARGGTVISRSVETRSMSFIQRGFGAAGKKGGATSRTTGVTPLATLLGPKSVLQPLHCLEMTKSVIAAPSETGFDNGQATVKLLNDLIETARGTWSEANAAVIAFQKRRKPVTSPPPQPSSSNASPKSNALSRRNSIKSPSPAGSPLASESMLSRDKGTRLSHKRPDGGRRSAASSPYPSSSSEDDFEPVSSSNSQLVDGAMILRLLNRGPSISSTTTTGMVKSGSKGYAPSGNTRATPTPPSGLTSPPDLALNPHPQQQDASDFGEYPSFRSNDSFRGSDTEGPAAAPRTNSSSKLRQMRPPSSPNRPNPEQQQRNSSSNISASALFPKHQDPSPLMMGNTQQQQPTSSVISNIAPTNPPVQRQNTPYSSGAATPLRYDSSPSLRQQPQQHQQPQPQFYAGSPYPNQQQLLQQPQTNAATASQYNSHPTSLNNSFNPALAQQQSHYQYGGGALGSQQPPQQVQQQQSYNDSSSWGGGSDSASNPNSSGGRNAARFDPMSLQQTQQPTQQQYSPSGPYPSLLQQPQVQPSSLSSSFPSSPLGSTTTAAAPPNQFQGHKIIKSPPQQGTLLQQNGAPPPTMHLRPPGSHPSAFPVSPQTSSGENNNNNNSPNAQKSGSAQLYIGECTPVTVCNSNKEWVQKYWRNAMKGLVRHPSWQPHLEQGFVCYSIDHTELQLYDGKQGHWIPETMQTCAPMLFLEKGETVYATTMNGDYVPSRAE